MRRTPPARPTRRTSLAALAALPLLAPALARAGDERLEARVAALAREIGAIADSPAGKRGAALRAFIDAVVDLDAWCRAAVPDWAAQPRETRLALLERARRLLVARALGRLDAGRRFAVEVEKTRASSRHPIVDCLVHTADASYEIGLVWSGDRVVDVQLEGLSVATADRRRIARAWRTGGAPAALAALDRAIAAAEAM